MRSVLGMLGAVGVRVMGQWLDNKGATDYPAMWSGLLQSACKCQARSLIESGGIHFVLYRLPETRSPTGIVSCWHI